MLAYGLCGLIVSSKMLRHKWVILGLVLVLGLVMHLGPELSGASVCFCRSSLRLRLAWLLIACAMIWF